MTKSVFNWNFYDVEKFLKKHGFQFNHAEGSHYYFIKSHSEIIRQVCIPFHGNKTIKPKTIKGMIAQSGIPKEEWLK